MARELNLKQIKKIAKEIDVECFCHGAMCVAISGRCFTSQFIHKTSANRGKCAHPCRREWTITDDSGNQLKLENNKVMSVKDLCTLPFIKKMKDAGIVSFKVEGRNRTPEYVYTVTREYRKALDKNLTTNEINESINELEKVYNRGFSDGFYLKMPTSDDFSYSMNGEQTEKKIYIGKIYSYLPKINVGLIKIATGGLKINDEIYLYHLDKQIERIKVTSIEKNNRKVNMAKKGDEIGLKLPNCKKNTDIYLIKKSYN